MAACMHLHILGICGTFMGGIALLARAAGHTVTGCDANVYPPMSTQLEAHGIRLIEGWDAAQLDLRPDVFVIGNVVSRGNALMEAILDRALPYTSGPQWLGDNVLRGRRVLAGGCWGPVERFGVATGGPAGAIAGDASFEVARNGEPMGRVRWNLLG